MTPGIQCYVSTEGMMETSGVKYMQGMIRLFVFARCCQRRMTLLPAYNVTASSMNSFVVPSAPDCDLKPGTRPLNSRILLRRRENGMSSSQWSRR